MCIQPWVPPPTVLRHSMKMVANCNSKFIWVISMCFREALPFKNYISLVA